MRVVATAGHVDHGKSTLVHALTGTDPDRFPEEKARGLTIDLGFAFCTLPSGMDVGFVDVPGHTRFIKNMLAGVGAVDVAMLVVAANEGWKPQSEEHLRILDLLGVRHGIVVVTKSTLVDDETLEIAQLEVADHVEGTTFDGLEVVTCDARSGLGLDAVRAALDTALAAAPSARDDQRARLWIDRVFAAKGAGTVVTGTLTGGTIETDDELEAAGHRVRVRGIESHGMPSGRGEPGARVALNLVGVDRHQLARGDAVVRPGQWLDVGIVDVALRTVPGTKLKSRGRLIAAVGSGEHTVWFRRLDDDFGRLRFDTQLPLAPGDRIVLRDSGAETTVAGAEVLDVRPTRRAADAPARLRLPLGRRLLEAGWVPVAGLDAHAGLAPDAAMGAVHAAGAEAIGTWFVADDAVADLRARVVTIVADHHRAHPNDRGLPLVELARQLKLELERTEALVATVAGIVVEQGQARAANHSGGIADTDAGRAMVDALAATPLSPPPPTDLATARALVRERVLVDLDGVYFTAAALDEARALVIEALAARASLTIADARDVLGSSRKYVVPIMVRMDAEGVTRRRGDQRIPGPRSGLLDA